MKQGQQLAMLTDLTGILQALANSSKVNDATVFKTSGQQITVQGLLDESNALIKQITEAKQC